MNCLYAGIDESNKGEVLGPIFVVICVSPKSPLQIPYLGDSKKHSKWVFESLEKLLVQHQIKYYFKRIQAEQITHRINVNHLIMQAQRQLISLIGPDLTHIDCHYPDPLKLKADLNLKNIKVSHRADLTDSLVAFASLVAYKLKKKYFEGYVKTHGQVGSGNLSDPKTAQYLRSKLSHSLKIPGLKAKYNISKILY